MTTTSPALTPKQKKVLDLMEKGVAPAEIAKRLKISASGVYAHKRNIEQLLGRTLANGTAPTAPAPPATDQQAGLSAIAATPAVTAVAPVMDNASIGDPVDVLTLAVERDRLRGEQIATEIAELTAEQEEISARLGKYTAALEALA